MVEKTEKVGVEERGPHPATLGETGGLYIIKKKKKKKKEKKRTKLVEGEGCGVKKRGNRHPGSSHTLRETKRQSFLFPRSHGRFLDGGELSSFKGKESQRSIFVDGFGCFWMLFFDTSRRVRKRRRISGVVFVLFGNKSRRSQEKWEGIVERRWQRPTSLCLLACLNRFSFFVLLLLPPSRESFSLILFF